MTGKQFALLMGVTAVGAAVAFPFVFPSTPQSAIEQVAVPASVAPQPSEPVVAPQPPEAEVTAPALAVDLFRVDETGQLLVAGKGPAGADVEVLIGDQVIGQGPIDTTGSFAIFADIGNSPQDRVVSLRSGEGAQAVQSDTFIVAGRAQDAAPDARATVIVAEADTVRVITPPTPKTETPPEAKTLILDSIGYDSAGAVQLAGRAPAVGAISGDVRVYLDNALVAKAPIADGAWDSDLPQVDPGTYTLRVDQVDSSGQVTARVETPFKREEPTVLAAAAQAQDNFVSRTIQPGATLWAIAEERYGNGVFYLKVFEANRDTIRDPDLIYPGQVFSIPD